MIVPRVTEGGRLNWGEFWIKEAENNLQRLPQFDGFERSTVTSCRTPTVIGQRRWKCYKRCHSQSNKNTFTIVIKNAINFKIVLRSFFRAIFFSQGSFEVYVKPIRGRIFRFFTDLSGLTLGRFFKGKSKTVDGG